MISELGLENQHVIQIVTKYHEVRERIRQLLEGGQEEGVLKL